MQFNQEEAKRAGQAGIQTGPVKGVITAQKIIASTGTKGIEFAIETDSGSKAQFLSVYYEKADGAIIKSGNAIIMAMMGLLKLQSIDIENLVHTQPVREFMNRPMGLVLQKVLYTKNDNTDGYKFEIRLPFSATTGKTFREAIEDKPAKSVIEYCESLKDRDDRLKEAPTIAQREAAANINEFDHPQQFDDVPTDFDNDIPF